MKLGIMSKLHSVGDTSCYLKPRKSKPSDLRGIIEADEAFINE